MHTYSRKLLPGIFATLMACGAAAESAKLPLDPENPADAAKVAEKFCNENPKDEKCAQQKFCDAHPTDPDCTAPTITTQVSGNIDGNVTWTKDQKWTLAGKVSVTPGSTLTIEAGTLIVGQKDPLGWLQVQQGGRLVARGTAAAPIVFTSALAAGSRGPGDWGGVVINGKAPINVAGGIGSGEGDSGVYGGSNASDDSGVLQYVRIEFAGWELSPDNELNGLTLNGVGRGTTLDHVESANGFDDAIEFFGGTVNGHHLMAIGTTDDCFDWDDGFTGKLQFLYCHQTTTRGDNGFEGDNNRNDFNATPRSAPQIWNATLVGRNNFGSGGGRGMMMRRGSAAYIRNSVITLFQSSFDLRDGDGSLITLENNLFFANGVAANATGDSKQFEGYSNSGAQDTDADGFNEHDFALSLGSFAITDRHNTIANPSLTNTTVTAPNPVPAGGSAALTGGATPPADGFFDANATYRGAFSTTDWTSPWAKYSAN